MLPSTRALRCANQSCNGTSCVPFWEENTSVYVAVASGDASVNGYGPAEGLPALRDALKQKLADKNGLTGVSTVRTRRGGGCSRWVNGGRVCGGEGRGLLKQQLGDGDRCGQLRVCQV